MIIRPADNWRWYFDEELQSLMLDLSNGMVFRCRYSAKMLTADAYQENAFSVADATIYYQLFEACAELALSEPQKVELVLNGLAARNFLKPQMPKSWYFAQQQHQFQPSFAEQVEASIQESGERLTLLALDIGDNASLCIIAQPYALIAGKTFELGDVVKVMHDRLASKNYLRYGQFSEDEQQNELVYHFLNKVC